MPIHHHDTASRIADDDSDANRDDRCAPNNGHASKETSLFCLARCSVRPWWLPTVGRGPVVGDNIDTAYEFSQHGDDSKAAGADVSATRAPGPAALPLGSDRGTVDHDDEGGSMTTTTPVQDGAAAPTVPKGRFFDNQTFHFETLRQAGYTFSNCADLSEILETVQLIAENEIDSWYTAWKATADRVLALAERTQDPLSKGGAYMRACTYERTAEFLLRPEDSRRKESFENACRYFVKGLDMLGVRYEPFDVPYSEAQLRALYYPGPPGAESKPLIMFGGGFDSILEEYYPNLAEAASKRGYSVLTYEGPGQGRALRKYGLPFTPEWEKPVAAVLNEFLRAHAKPSKIVFIGMSMGGYLAPRAAAFEERIDGVVSYDTMYDFGAVVAPSLAAARNPGALNDINVSWGYYNALWTMGTKDADETIKATAAYTLAPVADRIRQDVLILAGMEDHFVPINQTQEYEKALVNARSVTPGFSIEHRVALAIASREL